MEQSSRRAAVFAPLRERVAAVVTQKLDDAGALQLALACALRDPEAVVGFMFSSLVARQVRGSAHKLALTRDEWDALFGGAATPLRDGGLNVVQSPEFRTPLHQMAQALRCTISETKQASVWARPWSQALAHVAVHLREPDVALESVLGAVVRADSRRLEELHASIDDDGYDTILMSSVLVALTMCVL